MNVRNLMLVGCLLFSSRIQARTPSLLRHPICATDLWNDEESTSTLMKQFIRPGLLHVQHEVCRCLPRWRKNQPPKVRALLHIAPNKGEVRVTYSMDPPWSRSIKRMATCLGEQTLSLEPMAYVSDMITENGRVEEVWVYPIDLVLERPRP